MYDIGISYEIIYIEIMNFEVCIFTFAGMIF